MLSLRPHFVALLAVCFASLLLISNLSSWRDVTQTLEELQAALREKENALAAKEQYIKNLELRVEQTTSPPHLEEEKVTLSESQRNCPTGEKRMLHNTQLIEESVGDTESYTEYHLILKYAKHAVPQWERLQTIKSLLLVATQFMEKHRITYWLSHGTLLGSYRGGKIIPWDEDADVAITLQGYLSLVFALWEDQLASKEVRMIVREFSNAIPLKLVNITNGVYVDFLLYQQMEKRVTLLWPYSCKSCKNSPFPHYIGDLSLFLPTKPCSLEGHTFQCPQDPETVLKQWYGNLEEVKPKWWKGDFNVTRNVVKKES